ncbi:MAG: heavy metal translocating P-type ATPase metal-binding domain-containing protein [Verrucomicrobiales bacterium]|nr:heavy metal translocating P-type ATPase metal-binding domain-containing protein [Verrucomicrobiales bacterium]
MKPPAPTTTACRHCGTPVPPGRTDAFCCAGCAAVHELLLGEGLDRFYDLRGSQQLTPVAPESLRERDYDWLSRAVTDAEQKSAADANASAAHLDLSVQGLSCIGCVWLIEKVYQKQPGARRIDIDPTAGSMELEWHVGSLDAVEFARELQRFGYLVGPRDAQPETSSEPGLQRRLGACGAFAMNAMAFSLPRYFGMPEDFPFAAWFEIIAAASATLALIVGGSYFIERAWRSLQMGALHLDTPIALGIVTAYIASLFGWLSGRAELNYFDFVATFIFLMLAGRWLQQRSVERNRRRLLRDASIPRDVRSPSGEVLPLTALTPGTLFVTAPGQALPVRARLLDAAATISLEWINGESEAVRRQPHEQLPAGAMNIGATALDAEALESWEESTLRHLLEARRAAPRRDPSLENLLRGYLGAVLAAALGGGLWWWVHGASWVEAISVTLSVLVISCPCALGVALPLAEELAASRAQRLGVFVREPGLWRRLRQVVRVVFDKTGTLTLENPVLAHPETLNSLPDDAKSALRRLVSTTLHPVSRSLFDALGPGPNAEGTVDEVVGHGLTLNTPSGPTWELRRPGENEQNADAVFTQNGATIARFQFEDRLRPASVEELTRLRQRGFTIHVLSGDQPAKVQHILDQLHLPPNSGSASMSPAAKADWLRQNGADRTLFIGDGANDSLAFDEALCSGSPMGGRSFLEQKADFYFLGTHLAFVQPLLDLAARHRIAVRRAFLFALFYNIAAVSFCLAGRVNPLIAAILMPLSSLLTLTLVMASFPQQLPTPKASES